MCYRNYSIYLMVKPHFQKLPKKNRKILTSPFEDAEAEGGLMVKTRDFGSEKKICLFSF